MNQSPLLLPATYCMVPAMGIVVGDWLYPDNPQCHVARLSVLAESIGSDGKVRRKGSQSTTSTT